MTDKDYRNSNVNKYEIYIYQISLKGCDIQTILSHKLTIYIYRRCRY